MAGVDGHATHFAAGHVMTMWSHNTAGNRTTGLLSRHGRPAGGLDRC